MDGQFPLRIHQDENFTANGFSGKQLEQLIGFEYIDQPGTIIVYIKAEDKFFLDAGMGFWEHTETRMKTMKPDLFMRTIQSYSIYSTKLYIVYTVKKYILTAK